MIATKKNVTNPPKGLELGLTQALAGMSTVFPQGSSLLLNGSSVTQAQLVTELQTGLAPFQAVRTEHATYQQKLLARASSEAASRELLTQLRAALVAFLGTRSPQLAQFGISPKTKVARTAGQIALSSAKARVTRKLRNPLTAKQQALLKVEGTPGVTINPDGGLNVTSAQLTGAAASAAPVQTAVASPVTPAAVTVPVALPVPLKTS